MLRFMGLQRVGHGWATEVTELTTWMKKTLNLDNRNFELYNIVFKNPSQKCSTSNCEHTWNKLFKVSAKRLSKEI